MAEPRKRRIVRRVVLVCVAIVLLPVWYVGSYCSTWWLAGRGILNGSVHQILGDSLFSPLMWHEGSGHPSGDELCAFRVWCYLRGCGSDETWEQVRADFLVEPIPPARTISD